MTKTEREYMRRCRERMSMTKRMMDALDPEVRTETVTRKVRRILNGRVEERVCTSRITGTDRERLDLMMFRAQYREYLSLPREVVTPLTGKEFVRIN